MAGLIGVMILVAGVAFLVGSPGIVWPTPLFKILMCCRNNSHIHFNWAMASNTVKFTIR